MAALGDVLRKRIAAAAGGGSGSGSGDEAGGEVVKTPAPGVQSAAAKTPPGLAILMGRAGLGGATAQNNGGLPAAKPKMTLGIGDIVMARKWVGAAQRRSRFSE